QLLAVRTEGHAVDLAGRRPGAHLLHGAEVPEFDGHVVADRGEQRAIGTEGHAEDDIGMSLEDLLASAGLRVPENDFAGLNRAGPLGDVEGVAAAGRGEQFTVRTVGDTINIARWRVGAERALACTQRAIQIVPFPATAIGGLVAVVA